ncbi:hypothetical protein GGR51DRAFT_563443 [Nemania sp. FL0031]|nr:hypothetical protein GGR51DRAFT_563443 [Nemania sp. FL0031]
MTFRQWILSAQILFWISLYCVKASFLLLYRLVFGTISKYKAVWIVASTYTVVSFGLCLANVLAWCGGDAASLLSIPECGTPSAIALQKRLVWLAYFFNVTSDFVIILLPMLVIWRLNMATGQKLALSAICGLAIITVAFETVRSVKLYQVNNYLTNLYGYLELLVSVLISMLPSYRFLVSPSDKDREYRRIFWSRITLRSVSSNSSFSMHSYNRPGRNVDPEQSSQRAPARAADSQEN